MLSHLSFENRVQFKGIDEEYDAIKEELINALKATESVENLAKLVLLILEIVSLHSTRSHASPDSVTDNQQLPVINSRTNERCLYRNKGIFNKNLNSFFGKLNGWHAKVVEHLGYQLCNSINFQTDSINVIEKENCEICFNKLNDNESSTYLKKCGHSFCNPCLIHYLLLGVRSTRKPVCTCPVCNKVSRQIRRE